MSFDVSRKYKPIWSRQENYKKLVLPNLSNLTNKQYSWVVFEDSRGISKHIISILRKNNITPVTITFSKNYKNEENTAFTIDPTKKEHYLQFLAAIKNVIENPIIIHASSCSNSGYEVSGSTEIDKQLTQSFYSLLYLTQAYIDVLGSDVHGKITVITNNTQMILGTEKMNPINAALIGASRVTMQEYENLKIKLIDINLAEDPAKDSELLNYIVHFCTENDWYNVFINSFRNNHLWHLMYAPINTIQKKINRLKDYGVYLFTGGLGGIALSCCEVVAREVKNPKFILLSRSSLPKKSEWGSILKDTNHKFYTKIRQLKILENLGAEYYLHQVDIIDLAVLKVLVEQSIKKFSRIDGLIHTAGILNSELIQLKSKLSAETVLAPKVLGTYNLISALRNTHLDFVILKSSLSALLGGVGQIDYSSANSCLDTFASSNLFSFASHVTSINWNAWQEIGMAANIYKDKKQSFIGQDNDVSIKEGQKIFLEILQENEANIAISKTDINSQSFTHNLQQISREDLAINTQYKPPTNDVEFILSNLWKENLGLNQIRANDNFFDLGGHSLNAVKLLEKINRSFDCSLTIQHLYDAPTISKFSDLIQKKDVFQTEILVPMKNIDQKPPFIFLCHPASGMVQCFNNFTKQWKISMPIYGIQDPGISKKELIYKDINEMAKNYFLEIKKIQPSGPYYLIGYSFGGNIALEIANLMEKQNDRINLLVMLDSWSIFPESYQTEKNYKEDFTANNPGIDDYLVELAWKRILLLQKHRHSKINQNMLLIKAKKIGSEYRPINLNDNGWDKYNKGKIFVRNIDCNHNAILDIENIKGIIEEIEKLLKYNRS